MFDDINLAFACGLSVLALLGLLRFFRRSLGFQAQTGGNFRTPLILLESLHKGDFLGETRKSSADRWSKSRSHMDGRSHDTKKQGKK